MAERVARRALVRVVADRTDDEVRAVRGDHARLREPRARVVLLHDRVHARDRDDEREDEVEGDEEAVEAAAVAREEDVEEDGHGDREDVHGRGRADEDPLPHVGRGGRVLPVLKAGLGPGVREVDEKDETEEDKDGGADHGYVVAPDHEEAIRNEERNHDQDEPSEHFRPPPPER